MDTKCVSKLYKIRNSGKVITINDIVKKWQEKNRSIYQ